MTCEERRDIVFLYAAGALDAPEQEELRVHLSTGCPSCAGALAQAEASLAELPLALPHTAPPPEARDRLMTRIKPLPTLKIAGTPATEPARPRAGSTPRSTTVARWSILSALTGLAAGIAIAFSILSGPDPVMTTRLAEAESRLKNLDVQLIEARSAVQMLNAEKLRMVSLANDSTAVQKPTGRILYDEDNRLWHVRVFDLKPLPPDKTYELWFIMPDQRKIRAGIFNTDERGNGAMMVEIPKDIKDVAVAAITDEPAGGVDVPTGSIHLAGQVNKL